MAPSRLCLQPGAHLQGAFSVPGLGGTEQHLPRMAVAGTVLCNSSACSEVKERPPVLSSPVSAHEVLPLQTLGRGIY